MTNEELFEKAVEAVRSLFSDTSVSRSVTEDNLNSLIGEIEVYLDALERDRRLAEDESDNL
jgi:hypothetical protein